MKKIFTLALFFLLCAASLFASGQRDSPKLIIRVGHVNTPGDVSYTAWEFFKAKLEARTQGAVRVTVFPAAQLGDERELIEQVEQGSLDMATVNIAPLALKYPKFNIYVFPYIWKDRAHMFRFIEGAEGRRLSEDFFKQTGITIASYWDNGERHMFQRTKPINAPGDFEALKVRSMNNEVYLKFFAALGAKVFPLGFGEVYYALKSGVIDAADNDMSGYISMKFYETARYLSLTGHVISCKPVLVSASFLSKLTTEQRELLRQVLAETEAFQRKTYTEQIQKDLATIRSLGVAVNEVVGRDAFREIAKNTVWKFFAPIVGQDLLSAAINTP